MNKKVVSSQYLLTSWIAWVVLLGICLPILIAIFWPYSHYRLPITDPWTYQVAIEHFADGMFVLDRGEMATARSEIRLAGGIIALYVEIADGQWALRQSFGYPFLAIPFQSLGVLPLLHVILAGVSLWLSYLVLGNWFERKTAVVGTLLLAWTPITIMATHQIYMDTFSAGAFLVISACLLFLWANTQQISLYSAAVFDKTRRSRQKRGRPKKTSPVPLSSRNLFLTYLLPFGAGFCAATAVVTRSSNLLPAVVFGLFFLYLLWRKWQNTGQIDWFTLSLFTAGGLIPLFALLTYHQFIFGSPLATGYDYPTSDDIYYLWKGNPATEINGVETWVAEGTFGAIVKTIFLHFQLWSRPGILSWPIFPIMLLSVGGMFWYWRPSPLILFLIVWVLAVYALYAGILFFGVTRALTASGQEGWGFFVATRYMYPATWPIVILALDWISRWSLKWQFGFTLVYMVIGLAIFIQTGSI